VHPLLQRCDEFFHCLWRAFCFQLYSPIGHVLNPPRNLEFFGNLQSRIAKTNSLNAARKKNSFVMNFRHSVEGKTYEPVSKVSIHKTMPDHLRAGLLHCIMIGPKQLETTAPATP
jgi:hypothetical protein